MIVWKSLAGDVVFYRYEDLVISYHFDEEATRVIEVTDLKRRRSLCLGDHGTALYEVSLLNIEKQVSSLLEGKHIFLLHAASLEKDGKGILFPATNGFGKTTLTLSLLKDGFKLLSDDKVFVDSDENKLLYYPRRLRVDRNTIRRLPEHSFLLKRRTHKFLRHKEKWLVSIDEIISDAVCSETHLTLIMFPTIWINKGSKVVTSKLRDSLLRMLNCFQWPMTIEKRKLAFDLITRASCFELLMGSEPEDLGKKIFRHMEAYERQRSKHPEKHRYLEEEKS